MKSSLLIALACLLWALDTLIRYPLLGQGASALEIVFKENLLLGMIFLPFFLRSARRFLNLTVVEVFCALIIGVVGQALATWFFTSAFMLLNPSHVILIQKLQPLVAVSLGALFLREPIRKAFVLWAIVAVIGAFLISYDYWQSATPLDLNSKTLKGLSFALLAVLGWGSSTVAGRYLALRHLKTSEIMSLRFVLGPLALLAVFFYQGESALTSSAFLTWGIWGKIAVMVILSGVMAMAFYYQGFKKTPARLATLLEMLFPFFAVIINWLVLKVELSFVALLGGALLLISSTIIQIKKY